ncbi:MAG: hypothetical protein ACLRNQ_21475 [Flavonifractor plautii]
MFPEEILRIGHTLDFQLGCVSKEVQQEVFGPELDTSSLCDWLNLHTAYDFALQDVADHIEITLCRNFGKKAHPFLYPLNRAERDVLRGEMEACLPAPYRPHTGTAVQPSAGAGGGGAAGAHGWEAPHPRGQGEFCG